MNKVVTAHLVAFKDNFKDNFYGSKKIAKRKSDPLYVTFVEEFLFGDIELTQVQVQ